jgi:hypothetical protein
MFCAPGLIFGGTERVGSRFHVLRSRTHFRRYRGRRVSFSCFALPDSFSTETRRRVPFSSFPAVLWASCPIFMSCALILNFGGTESVRIGLHVLRTRTHFRRYRGRLVSFSCFAYLNSFSTVPRTSAPVFMFCVPELIFYGTKDVGSRFHVLRARTHFRRYRGRRDHFFMFCAPELVFGGTEGVGTSFHALRAQTHFLRYQGRWLPFSCFAVPDSFLAVPRALGPDFMFCAPGLIFGGTMVVGSRFHVLRSRTHFRRYQGAPVFMFCSPRLIFSGTDGD